MKIEKRIASPEHYSDMRREKIIYIVVQNINNKATPHYHISNGKAIQVVPDDYMSNSVNGGRLNQYGTLHGVCTKYNSISIGVNDIMSEEDVTMCLNLIMTLKQRYRIENCNIIRQKDVTGEASPENWANDDAWNMAVKNKLIDIVKVAE